MKKVEVLLRSDIQAQSYPFAKADNPKFTFIDLFAGIGGFRLALQNLEGECVFTSEWDQFAKQTYFANFGDIPDGDITLEETKNQIPKDFDLLCAGFPCQAFSIAGKRGGFNDTRGTLFFDVADIIQRYKPKAFLLENVKGIKSHDKGRTINTILNVLRNDLGYYVPDPQILNAKDFGVPQNRERIFIVGFRYDLGIKEFEYPEPTIQTTTIEDIFEENEVSVKYYLSQAHLDTLIRHKERNRSKGNGFGFEIKKLNDIASTITVGGMGYQHNLIVDKRLSNFNPITRIKGEVNKEGIRKLTPREWARLQGYHDNYKIVTSDSQAYKQFGNSVAVPVVEAIAQQILIKLSI